MKKLIHTCGILFILMVLLGLFNNCRSQQPYEINKEKWWGLGLTAAAGFLDGVVEGYEFDGRTSFERKWGVDPHSFFGSRSWDMPMSPWEKNFGRFDFYHLGDDLRKVGYIGGGITVGIGGAKRQQKWFHYLYDFALSFAISGAAKAAGMYYVRNIDSW